ncbi:MAG: CRTAC1 family protein, partial [Acidobacteria bacterium]
FGDIDNDGDLDVLVNNIDGPPTLLYNQGDRRHHAVMIRLIGRTSNRDGIGARVAVKIGSLVQIDEVRSGGSYLSQNDLRLHFGLGEHDGVDVIEIRWPSGLKQTFTHVKADRLLIIQEGRGMIQARPFVGSQRR